MSAANFIKYRNDVLEMRLTANTSMDQKRKGNLALRSIMSANLFNLMPGISVEKHKDVIDNISHFQNWAVKDQNHVDLVDHLVFVGPQPDFVALRKIPTIFCSYHLGSYRLLVPYLVRQGLNITLLIDSAVARMQADDFRSVVQRADPAAISEGRFEIIDTAHANLIITMARALRQGRSLVVFIDGNSSVGGNEADPDNMETLQFLGQTIYARKGVAFLSHMMDVSVTPVLLYRGGEGCWENHLRWYSPVIADGEDRTSYVRATVIRLYGILEEALPAIFEQWECWRYIEKSLAICHSGAMPAVRRPHAITQQTSLLLNTDRYAKYQLDDEQYLLFDRCSYRSRFISSTFSAFLDSLTCPKTIEACLSHPNMTPTALQRLLEQDILICDSNYTETHQ